MRRHRADSTNHNIVEKLRAEGYTVEIIGRPVDLATRHYLWVKNVWAFAEAKTPNRSGGKYKPRPDQEDQAQYCIRHCIPYWTSPETALEWLRDFEKRNNLKAHV